MPFVLTLKSERHCILFHLTVALFVSKRHCANCKGRRHCVFSENQDIIRVVAPVYYRNLSWDVWRERDSVIVQKVDR